MVTIGVDAHKRVHQALALDDAGTVLGSWRGANTPNSWQQLLVWAVAFAGPRHWGVEGTWNYGRGLAQFLVAQGEAVYEVNRPGQHKGRVVLAVVHDLAQERCAPRQGVANLVQHAAIGSRSLQDPRCLSAIAQRPTHPLRISPGSRR